MDSFAWNWPAVAALATVAIALITAGVGIATCYFIREGIRAMNKSSDQRTADRKEARAALEAWRKADERRHEEAMEEGLRRHEGGDGGQPPPGRGRCPPP